MTKILIQFGPDIFIFYININNYTIKNRHFLLIKAYVENSMKKKLLS